MVPVVEVILDYCQEFSEYPQNVHFCDESKNLILIGNFTIKTLVYVAVLKNRPGEAVKATPSLYRSMFIKSKWFSHLKKKNLHTKNKIAGIPA